MQLPTCEAVHAVSMIEVPIGRAVVQKWLWCPLPDMVARSGLITVVSATQNSDPTPQRTNGEKKLRAYPLCGQQCLIPGEIYPLISVGLGSH